MSEYDGVYGDCRDSCLAYLIEGGYACQACAEEMDMALEQEEEDFYEFG